VHVLCVQVIKDLKHLGDLLHEYLTCFQRASGNKDVRVVVFIDDLDRCKPSSIVEVSCREIGKGLFMRHYWVCDGICV
jgi:predicted KAP-like P-loop ATPase